MSTAIIGLAFDVIVAILLAVTIGFCWKLQERIRILQDSRSELATLVAQFNESTERAKASILDIQTASKLITESMQAKLEKANYIADDLTYMIEKATKLTGQMESGRNLPPKPTAAPAQAAPRTATSAAEMLGQAAGAPAAAPAKPPRSKAEQELLDALKSVR